MIKATKKSEPTKEVQPKKVEPKKLSQKTTDALSSLLNESKSASKSSDIDSINKQASNKGKINESTYANSYYGDGSGKGSLGLNGRKLSRPAAVAAKCNDEGTIVVQIMVNKSGSVTSAKFSPNGSNTTSKCLQDAAIASAKKYLWNDDNNAPDNQVGFIVFNFRNN